MTTAPTKQVPAREGWFTMDDAAPRLLGQRCATCGTTMFPGLGVVLCPNPGCVGATFEQVELSRRGRIWSYTSASYPPPPPFKAADPFEPFVIAAVELEREGMVILGQIVEGVGVDELEVGMAVEVALEPLYEEDGQQFMVWKWRPVANQGES